MRLLLDSHALYWAATEDKRLSKKAAAFILDDENDVFYSPLSFYEIMFKAGRGRIPASALRLPMAVESAFYQELSVTTSHLTRAATIEWRHGDPWDRILYAQALIEDMHLVSADRVFDEVTDRRIW
jgi:PIN domain nuclease of toxin-antitoxin system